MPRAAPTTPYDGRKPEPPYRTAQDDIDDAVALAIAEECERCAKVALETGRHYGEAAVGSAIANAIRAVARE